MHEISLLLPVSSMRGQTFIMSIHHYNRSENRILLVVGNLEYHPASDLLEDTSKNAQVCGCSHWLGCQ